MQFAASAPSAQFATILAALEARIDLVALPRFVEHLLNLPFRYFQGRTTGDLLTRLTSHVSIRESLTNQTVSAILDGSFVVFYLVLLMSIHLPFATAVLAIGMVEVGVLLLAAGPLYRLTLEWISAGGQSHGYLGEVLNGIATLKAAGGEYRALEYWTGLHRTQLHLSVRRNIALACVNLSTSALRVAAPLMLLWLGASSVMKDELSLGAMLALHSMAISFLTPLGSLVGSAQQMQFAAAQLERIVDVLEAEPEQNHSKPLRAPVLSGRIELRNVSFRYNDDGPWVLRNINLRLEPGQKVALVGRTGSGKSTLAKALLGLHPPVEGEILYDGQPLDSLDWHALRRQFGVVLQEIMLFSGTIRRNIAFLDPDLPMEAVRRAAAIACIDEEIERMPMQYDTVLGEGGGGLSGGQRQRVAIARALAHNPKVLVLDEATNQLDLLTEQRVADNLSRLRCLRVLVAHRLSTVRDADLILVMHEGQVVERGTHEQLCAIGGHYGELVRQQEMSMAMEAA